MFQDIDPDKLKREAFHGKTKMMPKYTIGVKVATA